MNCVRANHQKHATICPDGCGGIVEANYKFCPFCGREKHKGDKHAPSFDPSLELAVLHKKVISEQAARMARVETQLARVRKWCETMKRDETYKWNGGWRWADEVLAAISAPAET